MSKNSTIATMLQHRTIREFSAELVDDETVNTLLDVAMRTATSMGMQNTSIIRVKDSAKRQRLAQINGQEYVARAPIYLLFIVDLHRAQGIVRESGVDDAGLRTMDTFTAAFTDACLQAQNVATAAESLGLGATILGGLHNDPRGVIETLDLPELTYPVVGMILGHPAQEPQLKPRMPKSLRVMVDGYCEPDNWHDALADYDQEMSTYYDLRNANKPEPRFTDQMGLKYGKIVPKRASMLQYLSEQGFNIESSFE